MGQHEHVHAAAARVQDAAPPPRAVRAAAARLADGPAAPAPRLPRADGPLRALGAGAPLAGPLRQDLEQRLGEDLSDVRLHTDARGARAASALGADAVASGSGIAFGRSTWRPDTASGRELIAHEVTHVVQQRHGHVPSGRTADGTLAVGQHGDAAERAADVCRHAVGTRGAAGSGTTVAQLHSSHEHRMLGDLTPAQVAALAHGKAQLAAGTPPVILASMRKKDRDKALRKQAKAERQNGKHNPKDLAQVTEALHVVDQQLRALEHWRNGAPNAQLLSGTSTGYNVTWGGQLVTIPTRDGTPVVATVGDLNALPDFFGSFEDATSVSHDVLQRTLQVIRRETYTALKQMRADLTGQKYEYDHAAEGFGVATRIAVRGGGAVNDLKDMTATASLTKGRVSPSARPKAGARFGTEGDGGVEKGLANKAALGRNACHFPPESWLRWRDYHEKARGLIAGAATTEALQEAAPKAIAMNAFGEHYLQDSFAGGHLINKGFVMAYMQTKMTYITKRHRGITGEIEKAFMEATAHREAYEAPELAQKVVIGRKAGTSTAADAKKLSEFQARDPQAALDAARAVPGPKGKKVNPFTQYAHRRARARKEVQAAGLDPDTVTLEQYRRWLNDSWVQLMTNNLHNRYCEQGLVVGSPHKKDIGRVYGDKNMLNSAEGAQYTAETSQLSRTAINQLVQARLAVLDGRPGDAPTGIPSLEDVFARFPDRVHEGTRTTKLVDWATGKPMRDMIDEIVDAWVRGPALDGWKTRGVRLASPVKLVAGGLGAEHQPF